MIIINLIFIISLFITSIYLFKKNIKTIKFCNVIFILEIIYFLFIGIIGWAVFGMIPSLGLSIGAASGVSNMGITAQIITGYPIIGLIILNIIKSKNNKLI